MQKLKYLPPKFYNLDITKFIRFGILKCFYCNHIFKNLLKGAGEWVYIESIIFCIAQLYIINCKMMKLNIKFSFHPPFV